MADTPIFLSTNAPPLNLLVMGRDHKLYYEAYNDASDLNNDGTLDVGYKPTQIDYYGYFDSRKCYTYSSGRFSPAGVAGTNKTCSGQWSGDFLNYLTTSRIDALRKVFYGGKRSTDSTSATVLERSHIPQDAHSWGKEYQSVAADGYNISSYTPLSVPTSGSRHLFANTTLVGTTTPLLRVLQNRSERIWQWVSKEQPVADNSLGTPTDYTVRVDVCVSALLEDNCKAYTSGGTTVYKPTGLLHDYGENNRMMFGLLTGSYRHNTQGGVMRKDISSFTNEVNPSTGQFTSTVGIVRTLDRLITAGFRNDFSYEPGWSGAWITTRPINDGELNMWGNPVAEMMFEGLRYFAGLAPTAAFSSGATGSIDSTLNLPNLTSWANPYATYPRCAKPFMTVVSDINPSYDTDALPGIASTFGTGVTSDLPSTLNVSSIGDLIWSAEFGGSGSVFIGQSGTTYDGAPTAKTVTSFGNIRGLAPEEPTKNGGYYSASVAYHGLINDSSATGTGDQKVSTFAVALASPLPKIEINLSGRTITLVPFAKSVGGCLGINGAQGQFQPTNQIVDFYVESLTSTSGVFRVNFEDVEQGADHDMDAIVEYRYTVNPFTNTVDITLSSLYASGCIIQHAGYIVSGSTADGVYLEVRDLDTAAGSDFDYFLDTPNVAGTALPTTTTRTFSPASTGGTALALKDPLWYAAKWGGFKDSNGNNRPDVASEWDDDANGTPDNYFLVTNPLNLQAQMRESFNEILRRVSSFSNVVTNSGSLNANSALFQARFNSQDWSGDLLAYPISPLGTVNTAAGAERWSAAAKLADQIAGTGPARQILTYNRTTRSGVPFRWADLTPAQQSALNLTDGRGSERLDYVRGSNADEGAATTDFRQRNTRLGDIVNSSPFFVGPPAFSHPDDLETVAYSTFKSTYRARTPMVYVGANDGMLHAFNACTGTTQLGCSSTSPQGTEAFAYVPAPVYSNLAALTGQSYNNNHRYLVDGNPTAVDAFVGGQWRTVLVSGLRKGGRGIFALDVTDPATIGETSAASTVMWEFTSDDDADLGFVFSQPSIVKTYQGRWAAVIGNGYNNTGTGHAVLFIVFLDGPGIDGVWNEGTDYIKIDTGNGTLTTPNGLATPFAADTNGDRRTDFVYAGDLLGNLYRFDIRSSSTTSWNAASSRKVVFVARDAANNPQPITARPVVGEHPAGMGGYMVFFGTGKYLETADGNPTTQTRQTFYGIWDNSSPGTPTRADLVGQTLEPESSATQRILTNNPVAYTNSTSSPRGWYFDLPTQGERAVTDPLLLEDRVLFTTQIPSTDPCTFGGSGWLMELAAANGGRLDSPAIDINQDGVLNGADTIDIGSDSTTDGVAVSGTQFGEGMPTSPRVVGGMQPTGSGNPCHSLIALSDNSIKSLGQKCLHNVRGSWRQLR